ncbi:hypothetical protein EYC80_002575 [Monilinia laxa]|uniref:Uncharacterized protein n=1 Tax=Monilinia laxa TaxID=61186 RepID=A0A5N6K496_MONLA|nr:hypothetical protein EYC80_002575 [Monilinia laxa]
MTDMIQANVMNVHFCTSISSHPTSPYAITFHIIWNIHMICHAIASHLKLLHGIISNHPTPSSISATRTAYHLT